MDDFEIEHEHKTAAMVEEALYVGALEYAVRCAERYVEKSNGELFFSGDSTHWLAHQAAFWMDGIIGPISVKLYRWYSMLSSHFDAELRPPFRGSLVELLPQIPERHVWKLMMEAPPSEMFLFRERIDLLASGTPPVVNVGVGAVHSDTASEPPKTPRGIARFMQRLSGNSTSPPKAPTILAI